MGDTVRSTYLDTPLGDVSRTKGGGPTGRRGKRERGDRTRIDRKLGLGYTVQEDHQKVKPTCNLSPPRKYSGLWSRVRTY